MDYRKQISLFSKSYKFLARISLLLVFTVIVLGAYTRLTHSGLGCPDWPGCYHQLSAPATDSAVQQATKLFPHAPVDLFKAKTEMIHRYAAGILGIFILLLAIISIGQKDFTQSRRFTWIPITLVLLAIMQALLGMWTVTLKLAPLVVMTHLLGGFTLLALLWWLQLSLTMQTILNDDIRHRLRPWAFVGLFIILAQISLGAWTSANHAGLICPSFPMCSDDMTLPHLNFFAAFNLLHGLPFYNSTHTLGYSALVTIQMSHRLGAFITFIYLSGLSLWIRRISQNKLLQTLSVVLLALLGLQIMLGIMNVLLYLPLIIAILHNAVATLLLLTQVTIIYVLTPNSSQSPV